MNYTFMSPLYDVFESKVNLNIKKIFPSCDPQKAKRAMLNMLMKGVENISHNSLYLLSNVFAAAYVLQS